MRRILLIIFLTVSTLSAMSQDVEIISAADIAKVKEDTIRIIDEMTTLEEDIAQTTDSTRIWLETRNDLTFKDYIAFSEFFAINPSNRHLLVRSLLAASATCDLIDQMTGNDRRINSTSSSLKQAGLTLIWASIKSEQDKQLYLAQIDSVAAIIGRMNYIGDIYDSRPVLPANEQPAKVKKILERLDYCKSTILLALEKCNLIRDFFATATKAQREGKDILKALEGIIVPLPDFNFLIDKRDLSDYLPSTEWEGWDAYNPQSLIVFPEYILDTVYFNAIVIPPFFEQYPLDGIDNLKSLRILTTRKTNEKKWKIGAVYHKSAQSSADFIKQYFEEQSKEKQ